MTGVCDGLRVLDMAQGMAGAMVGMLLCDHGAEVVKLEPPQGDWSRGTPGFLMWNRGKQSVVLDLAAAADRDAAMRLAVAADVVVESFRPGVADKLGVGYAAVAAANPGVVHCSVSGFGELAGDLAHLQGYEGMVAAAIGRMTGLDRLSGAAEGFESQPERPRYSATATASFATAQLATQGVLAALLERRRSGRGHHVRSSLLQGAVAYLMRQEMPRGDAPREIAQISPQMHRGIELCFLVAECADGRHIQMCARQDHHFRAWMKLLGLSHIYKESRYERAPLGIPSVEDVEELEKLVRARMLQRSSAEWMELLVAADVGGDPFLTPDEFLAHPQMVENGRTALVHDPQLGDVRMPGPLVQLATTPAHTDRRAPSLGEHAAQSAWTPRITVQSGNGTASAPRPPLDGITILETAYFIAGPYASTLLAELGARVIKVETLDGDPYRRTGLQSAKFLHGKESIAVDLKRSEGTAVLHRLVERSDAFVHSFRPGVPERLCLDYPTLHALNRRLVYLYAGAYGSRGPWRARAGFHSTPTALSGAGILQAGRGNAPVDDSFPDPACALAAATALMLGLYARELQGVGQYMETTMLASTAHVMSPHLVRYNGAPDWQLPDAEQHGPNALYRLYPCRDGWIFLGVVQQREYEALATALGREDWLTDPSLADAPQRLLHDAMIADAVAGVAAAEDAQSLAARLQRAGVPAVAVSDVPLDAWLERHDMLYAAEHRQFGAYWRPPAKVHVGDLPHRFGPAAAVGEHSRALLGELGYTSAEIDRLVDTGVVGEPHATPRPAR